MQGSHASDAELVTEAAAALDTSEIAIFRRAWCHWYGAAPEEARIERPFVVYMFGGRAPTWVRDYARRVVSENRSGPIEPSAWGFRSAYVRNPVLGYALAVLTVVVVIALVVAADISAQYIAGIEGCLTPPCYDQNLTPPPVP